MIFREGYRDNRIEMSTCDAEPSGDSEPWILWDMSLEIQDAEIEGEHNQYYFNEFGNWEFIGGYIKLTENATMVIASSLDIYDACGNLLIKGEDLYR